MLQPTAHQQNEQDKLFKDSLLLQIVDARNAATRSCEKIKAQLAQQQMVIEASFDAIFSSLIAYKSSAKTNPEKENETSLPLDLSAQYAADSSSVSCNEAQVSSHTEIACLGLHQSVPKNNLSDHAVTQTVLLQSSVTSSVTSPHTLQNQTQTDATSSSHTQVNNPLTEYSVKSPSCSKVHRGFQPSECSSPVTKSSKPHFADSTQVDMKMQNHLKRQSLPSPSSRASSKSLSSLKHQQVAQSTSSGQTDSKSASFSKYKIAKLSRQSTKDDSKDGGKSTRTRSRSRSPVVQMNRSLSKSIETDQINKSNQTEFGKSATTQSPKKTTLNTTNSTALHSHTKLAYTETKLSDQPMPFGYHHFLTINLDCANCSEKFENQSDLSIHMLGKHKLNPFSCPLAGCTSIGFVHFNDLKKHIFNEHSNVNSWNCAMCNHCAGNGDKLKDHYLTFHQKGKFTCSVEGCGRTYGSRHCTYNHFVREHTKLNSVGKYDTQSLKENVRIRSDAIKRDGFGKTSEKNLPEIEVTINENKEKNCQSIEKSCFFPKCIFKYRHVDDLDRHIQVAHSTKIYFEHRCPILKCEALFESEDQLEKHFKTIHRCVNWCCPVCLETVKNCNELTKHNIQLHDFVAFSCNYKENGRCNFKSNLKSEVIKHYLKEHDVQ